MRDAEVVDRLSRAVRIAGITLGVLLPSSLLLLWVVGGAATWDSLWRTSGSVVALAVSCSFASYLVRAFRWRMLVDGAKHGLAPGTSILIFLAGLGLTASPGKLGELCRGWLVRHWNIDWSTVVVAFVFERGMDVLVIASLAIVFGSAAGIESLRVFVPLLVLLGVVGITLLAWPAARARGRQIVMRLPIVAKLPLTEVDAAVERCATVPRLLANAALSTIGWLVQGIGFTVLSTSLSSHISPTLSLAIFASAMLVGAASGVPGGLGATEAGLVAGLVLAGTAMSDAVPAALLFRMTSLWLATAVGLASMPIAIRLGRSSGPGSATALEG